MQRLIFPIVMGLAGCAILLRLGVWQVDRLGQKEAMLARIEARIGEAPGALPDDPHEARDEYLPVTVTGVLGGGELHVLKGVSGQSPAYRLIVPLDLPAPDGRRILADLGTIPAAARDAPRAGPVTLSGNLHWPDEASRWTPPPDEGGRLWYARDVAPMAEALGAAPVMVVAYRHDRADFGTTPIPVDTAGIPNDHLGYALTWFGLALVWAIMSLALIRRTLRSAP